MDDKEIMKEFEESFNIKPKEPVQTYRATRNLNTEIGNPTMRINDNMNVNIKQNGNIDNTMTTNSIKGEEPVINHVPDVSTVNPVVQPQNVVQRVEPNISLDVTEQPIVSTPLMNEQVNHTTTYISNMSVNSKKNKAKTKIAISPEVKLAILLALVLLIFILVMPTISEFFREIKLGLK